LTGACCRVPRCCFSQSWRRWMWGYSIRLWNHSNANFCFHQTQAKGEWVFHMYNSCPFTFRRLYYQVDYKWYKILNLWSCKCKCKSSQPRLVQHKHKCYTLYQWVIHKILQVIFPWNGLMLRKGRIVMNMCSQSNNLLKIHATVNVAVSFPEKNAWYVYEPTKPMMTFKKRFQCVASVLDVENSWRWAHWQKKSAESLCQ